MNRRRFLRETAVASAGLATSSGVFPTRWVSSPPQISCASWCFHDFGADVDTSEPIELIKKLGFDGIQLMINQAEDLDILWTKSKIQSVRKRLANVNLALVSLAPFFPCYPYLGSHDRTKVEGSLATFKRCCQLAQQLGTSQIEMLSPFASEFVDPNGGLFSSPFGVYQIDSESYKPGQKLTLQSSKDIQWDVIWRRVVGVMRECIQIAKRNDLTIVMEPHINAVVSHTDSFLLFWNELKSPALKLNSDTGWASQQAEYPPMNVYKTREHLQIMQFRDVDHRTRNFVPMGDGVVNVEATLDALQKTNFSGYLSFEEVFIGTVEEDARQFINTVKVAYQN